ncbi:MAG: winged helix-turn-helix transcriptional regulator [Candidatus Lokiarchaeota archaeon]|nr:winged helix-turn-helix transcriptional regulator [Candidatus Lokiarchaeota archaeon]MBD3199189.1 winged helix-turn-helix transcriptional regulator [Candidatus Lokiarchaeota archaeon]
MSSGVKKNISSNEMANLDDIDKEIMKLLQINPSMTHTEISTRVDRSQPTVGLRIKKLEDMGVLQFQAGINIKVADLFIARAEIQTKNPTEVLKIVEKCPFMLNAFRLSGSTNVSVILVNSSIDHLDYIVNHHFRKNPHIYSTHMDIITDVAKDFVLPLDVACENCNCEIGFKCHA